MSNAARQAVVSDLYSRSMPASRDIEPHAGRKFYSQIEGILTDLCHRLFGAVFSECRPTAGSAAEEIAIHALTSVGDPILCLNEVAGHRTWNSEIGHSGMRGLEIHQVPFDFEEWNVDLDGLSRIASQVGKASLLVVGTPLPLFPIRCGEIRSIADELGAKIMYDGAHVLGLIAGHRHPDPLREGADILTGSTHKTLSGPVGGMILTNIEAVSNGIQRYLPGHLSIFGHSRLAALAITLSEWVVFGDAFAEQIVTNAKTLAASLYAEGFDVMGKGKGFTESHLVLLNAASLGGGLKTVKKLEAANIIGSAFRLGNTLDEYSGLRLGVTEMTRYGMREPEMRVIAGLISEALHGSTNETKIAKRVSEFRSGYQDVRFSFELP